MHNSTCFLLVGLAILLTWSCRNDIHSEKLADVDGVIIRSDDLNQHFGKELFEQRERLYRLEKQKLDDFIGAQLLAAEARRRGLSTESFIEKEISAKVRPVSDKEIDVFYESNKSRIRDDLGKVREQIREHLHKQEYEIEKSAFLKSLRSKAKITIYLKAPPVFRRDVMFTGAPSRGPETAKVTIAKFEDFQCPYCKTVQQTFLEVLKRYDGKIRLVHKDLPLDAIHPQARPAAEAARCAGDQGKFWEYHDKLYAQSPKLAVAELKSAAKEIGLNVASFDQCLVSGKFKAAVQRDFNEAAGLGLTGTPAFFINGRELIGAQPIEAFTAIIDEELAFAK